MYVFACGQVPSPRLYRLLRSNIFQACDVPCDAQCRGGCNKAFDSRSCLECQNDKLFYTNTKFDCIEACDALYTDVGGMPTWTTDALLGTTIQTGNIHDNNGQNFGAGNITKAFIALEYTENGRNVKMCKLCHSECRYGCKGTGKRDCIHPDITLGGTLR